MLIQIILELCHSFLDKLQRGSVFVSSSVDFFFPTTGILGLCLYVYPHLGSLSLEVSGRFTNPARFSEYIYSDSFHLRVKITNNVQDFGFEVGLLKNFLLCHIMKL